MILKQGYTGIIACVFVKAANIDETLLPAMALLYSKALIPSFLEAVEVPK
jgi:hypothetical protein